MEHLRLNEKTVMYVFSKKIFYELRIAKLHTATEEVLYNGTAEYLARRDEEFYQRILQEEAGETCGTVYKNYSISNAVSTAKESIATALIALGVYMPETLILIIKQNESRSTKSFFESQD